MDWKICFRQSRWKSIMKGDGKKRKRKRIERIKEIYESTKSVVRINRKISESFWTEKGIRVSPLSLILSLLIADGEEEMKKEQVSGVQVGRERFVGIR